MQQIIFNFFIDNKYWLIPLLISVVEFIFIIICKKKPVIHDSSMYSDLSYLILQAEEKFGAGHGADKLNYVIDSFLHRRQGQFLDTPFTRNLITSIVEYLLSLPQKKGGN